MQWNWKTRFNKYTEELRNRIEYIYAVELKKQDSINMQWNWKTRFNKYAMELKNKIQ